MADIAFRLFITRNDKVEPFNGYTKEEKKKVESRLSKTMSAYLTQHPQEFKRSKNEKVF